MPNEDAQVVPEIAVAYAGFWRRFVGWLIVTGAWNVILTLAFPQRDFGNGQH